MWVAVRRAASLCFESADWVLSKAVSRSQLNTEDGFARYAALISFLPVCFHIYHPLHRPIMGAKYERKLEPVPLVLLHRVLL